MLFLCRSPSLRQRGFAVRQGAFQLGALTHQAKHFAMGVFHAGLGLALGFREQSLGLLPPLRLGFRDSAGRFGFERLVSILHG